MPQQKTLETYFDGLAGPSHHYAGLSDGNTASMRSKNLISNPRAAALEGLEKMKLLMDLGYKQAILPPQARPALNFLKKLGFSGNTEKILKSVHQFSPALLSSCYSSSSMWSANSAVISPSADTKDGKVHLSPSNLQSFLHRSLEVEATSHLLKRLFPQPDFFVHHPALPSLPAFSDEGSANHARICADYGSKGLELFVYGREGWSNRSSTSTTTSFSHKQERGSFSELKAKELASSSSHRQKKGRFAPRQSELASRLIARRHLLDEGKTIFALQNPEAIDRGVFHNDVIFAANQNLIFFHPKAFDNTKKVLKEIEEKLSPTPLLKIEVKDISIDEAVSSYLFNSQLLPLDKKGEWLLLAPLECQEVKAVKDFLHSLTTTSPIRKVRFVSTRQSMQNGGGPACLRLSVVLTEEEIKATHQGVFLNPKLYKQLKAWIQKHYREQLKPEDLLDPSLVMEIQTALEELSLLLDLKNLYSF